MVAEHNQHCEQTLMFTDIVGYSRLMGRNEAMAIEMLGDYRKILLSHIEQQGGQLVEFIGDAIFARFNSAASATAAAIAIQQHLQAFNEVRDKRLPPLQTRIGLHKGEVMLRDGAVFGDSVNIAARLEPLAVADGICISQTVFDEVRFTLSSPAKRLGVQALKNIEQKIRVYLIKPSGIGWRDHLFYFLRSLNKCIVAYRYPLTACLFALIVAGFYFIPRWLVPGYAANYVEIADFQNLMNEKGDADYFSAGITEAVRSQLADMRDVYLVESEKGIRAPVKLEGSVQKFGDNLRIVYRLFRRDGNVQIAGGKFDGVYQDVFILQDRLVGEIAKYLAKEFKLQNFRPAPLKLTSDITAYDYYLQGLEYLSKPRLQENFDRAIQLFSQALVHDSSFMLANSGLCEAYLLKNQLTKSSVWIKKAEEHCLRSLAQDENSAQLYASLGALYRDTGKYTEAIKYLEQAKEREPENVSTAIALARTYDLMQNEAAAEVIYLDTIRSAPKNWLTYQSYGFFLIRKGRHDEAIENYNKVLSLTPENTSALNNRGTAYLYKGEFQKAAQSIESATKIEPMGDLFMNAGSMYYFSGDFESAVKMYQQALRLEPDNVQFLVNIADACVFFPCKNAIADDYFEKAQLHAERAIKSDKASISDYQFMALANVHFQEISKAKEMMSFADVLDAKDIFSCYVNLRISISENDEDAARTYVGKLLAGGYSEKLILADPYFVILKERRFNDVFVK